MGPAVGPMIRWVTPPRVVSSHITFGPWSIFGGWYPCAIFTIFSKSATATACHGKWINKSFTAWYFKTMFYYHTGIINTTFSCTLPFFEGLRISGVSCTQVEFPMGVLGSFLNHRWHWLRTSRVPDCENFRISLIVFHFYCLIFW